MKHSGDTPEKYKYSPQEIVYSSGWITEDYRLADRNRQLEREQRKQQDAQNLGELYQIIEDENIVSLAHFVKVIYTEFPELSPLYNANHAKIRDYISSRRFDISCGFVDFPYGKVCEMLKAEQARCIELDNKVTACYQTIDTDKRQLKANEKTIAELKQSIYELQVFSQRLLDRNTELLSLLEFEELPINNDHKPEEGVEINQKEK